MNSDMNNEIRELTPDELDLVSGGFDPVNDLTQAVKNAIGAGSEWLRANIVSDVQYNTTGRGDNNVCTAINARVPLAPSEQRARSEMPWLLTSCGDRRQRRSMNWNAACAVASVPKSGAMQAEPSRVARDQERSVLDLVAGRAVILHRIWVDGTGKQH